MKSKWYHSRKKIRLKRWETIVFFSLSTLYIISLTIYLMYSMWNLDSINRLILKRMEADNITNSQAYTLIRLENILKYLGACAMTLLFIFICYWGRRRTEYGYLFLIFWIFIWVGILTIHVIFIVKNNEPRLFNIISIIPTLAIIVMMLFFGYRLYKFRVKLLFSYIERIRKGKERRL